MSDLDQRIDALYALPLADFTESRNRLAKELRSAGDREGAERVKGLRKPTVTAWAVNQIVHHYRDVFDATVEATDAVREAHAKGPAGLAEAMEARKDAITAAVEAARGVLTRAGHPPGSAALRKVSGTLEALAAGVEEATPGRLTGDLEPPGFGGLAGLSFAGTPKRARRSASTDKAKTSRPRSGGGSSPSARGAVRPAETSGSEPSEDAARRFEELRVSVAEAQARVRQLEEADDQARSRVAETQTELREAAAGTAEADELLEAAKLRARKARAREAEVRARLDALREQIDVRAGELEEARASLTGAERALEAGTPS